MFLPNFDFSNLLSKEGKEKGDEERGGRGTDPELSGNTAVSPARKSNVRAFCVPRKTVARASPLQKKSHSAAFCKQLATYAHIHTHTQTHTNTHT